MAKYRSLSQKNCIDFEVPSINLSMFAFCWPRLRVRASDYTDCYSILPYIPCSCGLSFLTRNQARFAFVFPFCFIASLKIVFDICEQRAMSTEILKFCRLHVFHGLHQTIMQFFLSGMQNTSRRIHISNGAADTIELGLQFKFSMHRSMLLFFVKLSPTSPLYTNLKWNLNGSDEFQVTYPCTTLIPYHTSSTLYFDLH
jgi:hypothetical protein